MRKKYRLRSRKAGLPPGSPVYVGEQQANDTKITVIGYDENSVDITEHANVEACLAAIDKFKITWIHIAGLRDITTITDVCKAYGAHLLVIEDILNTQQRPKLDVLQDYIFVSLRSYFYNEKEGSFASEQVSVIIGNSFVISIQEAHNDIFSPIKARLKASQLAIHKKGMDYLAYVLIDVAVDGYFKVAEVIGDEIEGLEEKVIHNPDNQIVSEMHDIKRQLIYLRKSLWPLRDVISGLQSRASAFITNETALYLRDVYDHTVQLIDTVETYRDFLSSILDIYLSSVSNKLNEVMKVLTTFASIFIPLGFIVGIYGMNFNTGAGPLSMPELNWRYGYISVWVVMIIVTVGMLVFFKKKKWW